MMPSSQSATTYAPMRGASATRMPAATSITPTISIAVVALPGTMSLIQGARYWFQSVRMSKNLSRPKRIGATVKTVRSSANAWKVGSLSSLV
jgi:hypothetical protein